MPIIVHVWERWLIQGRLMQDNATEAKPVVLRGSRVGALTLRPPYSMVAIIEAMCRSVESEVLRLELDFNVWIL